VFAVPHDQKRDAGGSKKRSVNKRSAERRDVRVQYPYRGVRGKGTVELNKDSEGSVLGKLIKRYLGNSNASLANWLMSRAKSEYALCLSIASINSWDFSNRMEKQKAIHLINCHYLEALSRDCKALSSVGNLNG
jgi:hypothetical protein